MITSSAIIAGMCVGSICLAALAANASDHRDLPVITGGDTTRHQGAGQASGPSLGAAQAPTSLRSLSGIGSMNDLNRGAPNLASPTGGGAKLPAIQRIRDRDACAPNCGQKAFEPVSGLAAVGGGANAPTQPPPPPPPPPPATPLPVLMVLPNVDYAKSGDTKTLLAPTISPGRAPTVSPSVGSNQTQTIGGAKTR